MCDGAAGQVARLCQHLQSRDGREDPFIPILLEEAQLDDMWQQQFKTDFPERVKCSSHCFPQSYNIIRNSPAIPETFSDIN